MKTRIIGSILIVVIVVIALIINGQRNSNPDGENSPQTTSENL